VSKYKSVPTVVDNVRFASKKEAARYLELKASLRAGIIENLVFQPRFPLYVNKIKVADYVADFSYKVGPHQRNGKWSNSESIVEDCKGMQTPIYRLKKKMFEAQYGLKILET